MKKILAPVAVLALALTQGCVANLATKRLSNNLPQFIDALGRDTNACHLRIISPAFTLEFDRNGGLNSPPSAASFSVTPTTTLQVQPSK